MTLEHEELTGAISGAASEVHRVLGPGFLEAIYENAGVVQNRVTLEGGSQLSALSSQLSALSSQLPQPRTATADG